MDRQQVLWYTDGFENIFMIPQDIIFPQGEIEILDSEGNKINTDLVQLNRFLCTKEQAHEFLKDQWENSFQQTKKAWTQLFEFSQRSGIGKDIEKLKSGFIDGLRESGVHVDEAFDLGRKVVEDFQKTILAGEPENEQEKQQAIKNLFGNFNDILSSFDQKNLENIAKDPDAWAEEMYRKVCGDMDKKVEEAKKERLTNDIKESISKGLRSVGMSPSQDWKSNEGK